jgi:dTMP kinase
MKYQVNFDIDFKRNESKGVYIALEGIDGSGKTTQVERLSEYFTSKGMSVIKTREPRKEGIIGDLVHKVLTGKTKFPKVALQYLFSTDRVLNHEEVIIPSLKKGKIVISDRCFWSAVVYGILDKGENYDNKIANQLLVAHSILSMYHQFTIPDFTFYLKIPLETSLERLKAKKDMKEIYESKEKIEGVLKGYDWLFGRFKNEVIVIDGSLPVEEITNQIIKIVEKKL